MRQDRQGEEVTGEEEPEEGVRYDDPLTGGGLGDVL